MIDRRSTLSVALPLVMASLLAVGACAGASGTSSMQATSDPNYVEVVPRETDRRVDVLVGGKPFTSYVWPTTLKKPVLYPLRAASGVVVTRGYPLEPRPGERVDHPHHAGMWFNYGDVNGLDFWNNSDAIPAAQRSKYGTIVHRSVRSVKSGSGEGVLETTEDWVTPDNRPILREDTRYVFGASLGARTIQRITTLTALDSTVSFNDNKEGVLGIRVARSLEHPSLQPEKFTDAQGNASRTLQADALGLGEGEHNLLARFASDLPGLTASESRRIALQIQPPARPSSLWLVLPAIASMSSRCSMSFSIAFGSTRSSTNERTVS